MPAGLDPSADQVGQIPSGLPRCGPFAPRPGFQARRPGYLVADVMVDALEGRGPPFRFRSFNCSQNLAKRLPLPRTWIAGGSAQCGFPPPWDASRQPSRSAWCLSFGDRIRTPALVRPFREGRPRAIGGTWGCRSFPCVGAWRSLGWQLRQRGIEEDFARLGEEAPETATRSSPNVRELGRRPERCGLCHRVRGHGSKGDRR